MPKVVSNNKRDNNQLILHSNTYLLCDGRSKIEDLEKELNKKVSSAALNNCINLTITIVEISMPTTEYSERLVNFLCNIEKYSSMSILIKDECSLVDIANKASSSNRYNLTAGKITSEPKS